MSRMTKVAAVEALMRQARADRNSRAAFERCKRACATLALNEEETRSVLTSLEFLDPSTGLPYPPYRQQGES